MYSRSTAIVIWPFTAVWAIIETVLKLVGHLVVAILGVAFMIIGIVLCLTIIGAIVGIPIGGLGFTMMIRALLLR